MHNDNLSLQEDKYIRLAKTLLLVGENNEDLLLKYLNVLTDGLAENGKPKKNIVIVGAGIAGLLVGSLLKRAGLTIKIVEANPHRIGGRIKTFKAPNTNLQPPFRNPDATIPFSDAKLYAEAGAMRIPSFHPLVLNLIDKYNLKRRLFFNVSVKEPSSGNQEDVVSVDYTSLIEDGKKWESPYRPGYKYQNPEKVNNTFIRTNGTQVKKSDYNMKESSSTVKQVNEGFYMEKINQTTSEILNKALDKVRKHITRKKRGEDKRVSKTGDALIKGWAEVIEKYDKHSMWSFMKEVAGMSDEEIEAIGTIENLTSRLALSFFHSFLGRSDINPEVTFWELEGGTEVLPYALLEELKENIVLNRRLVKLEYKHPDRKDKHLKELNDSGKEVRLYTVNEKQFANGELKDLDSRNANIFEGDYAILTLPFSSLRHVKVAPEFSYKKRRAIIELHYDAATKVLLEFSHRWWEMDEKEFQAALAERKQYWRSQTPKKRGLQASSANSSDEELLPWMKDENLRQFYQHIKVEKPKKLRSRGLTGKERIFGGGSVTDNPSRFIYFPAHQIEDSEGGVVLASYSWSDDARRWDSMTEGERYLYALRNMEILYGEDIKYFYTTKGKTQSWATDPYAYGEAAVFTPGQLSAFHLDIPTNEGPVYFAGEHVSLKHAWIEGSLETAIQAAIDIHERD